MAFKLAHGICLTLFLTAAGCSGSPNSAVPQSKSKSTSQNVEKPAVKPGATAQPAANQQKSAETAKTPVESPVDHVTRLGGKIEREGSTVTRIDFFGTQIGDGDLLVVREFPDLQSLGLNGTKVTDEGLETLVTLKKLNSLSLGFTDITDKGLFTLAKLPALQTVDLLRTKATSMGIAELQKALPKLNISK